MDASDMEETVSRVARPDILSTVPGAQEPYQKQRAVYFILASTFFEIIAFFAFITILFDTLQMNELFNWNHQNSQTALYIFSGTSYVSTMIFAILTDAKLGRARTIIIGFVLYFIGSTLVTITVSGNTLLCRFNTTDHKIATMMGDEKCVTPILGALLCTAIGAGAIKSNIAVFGAEQIQDSKVKSRYFDKYVVIVNIGATVSILVTPTIQNSLNQHYFILYVVTTAMVIVGALIFIVGRRYYVHVKPYDTVVSNCIPVFINAFQSWHQYRKNNRSIDRRNTNFGTSNLRNASQCFTEQVEDSTRIHERSSSFLDFAKTTNHGKFIDRVVDDVKSLRGALVVFALLIPYWLLYNQLFTTFQFQGGHMRTPSNAKYIVSWMKLGDPVTIIIGIFIFNTFVYKNPDTRDREVVIVDKFIIGMSFALISIWIAGIIELFRQQKCNGLDQSSLTVLAQLPQTIVMGFSEIFATVASYEFAYFAAPRSAQSLFMSLQYASIGVSSFIGTAYSNIFTTTSFEFNFNCSKSDRSWWYYMYFFILAGVQLVFIILFAACQTKFRIVKLHPQKLETNQFQLSSIS